MKQEEITLSELCAMSAYKTVCKGLYEEDGSWETRGMSYMEEVEGEIQQIYNLDEEDPMDIYLVIDEAFAGHFLWLLHTHDVEDGRSYVCEYAVLHFSILVLRHIDEWNGIE